MPHKKSHNNIIVIALGGSILVPGKIQTDYLKRLRNFLEEETDKNGRKFFIVIGGGAIARDYQNAASEVVNIENEDKDWLGIHATRMNAHLLRTIFYDIAYPAVLDSPHKPIKKRDFKKYTLFICSGWRPGWSTDYIAFCLAKRFGAEEAVIATKISHIYDKNVDEHKDAKPIERITWKKYKKLLPSDEWIPGMKAPVDPIATEYAIENNLNCVLLQGTDLSNLEKYLEGEEFEGSVIEN